MITHAYFLLQAFLHLMLYFKLSMSVKIISYILILGVIRISLLIFMFHTSINSLCLDYCCRILGLDLKIPASTTQCYFHVSGNKSDIVKGHCATYIHSWIMSPFRESLTTACVVYEPCGLAKRCMTS